MRVKLIVGALMATAALVTTACSTQSSPQPTQTSRTPTAEPRKQGPAIGSRVKVAGITANYHGSRNIVGDRVVTVVIEDGYFVPTVIKGSPGQKITLQIENKAKEPHMFAVDGRYIKLQVPPGQRWPIPLTLPQSGNLSFYSQAHWREGMAGVFNVSGAVAAAPASPTPNHR
jgi:hypothetical protein